MTKGAPPQRSKGVTNEAAPALSPPPMGDFSSLQEFERPRRGKAEGLDKSPANIQKLISAAGNGDVTTVRQLLDSGVDPDGPAKDGKTPLMAAATNGSVQVVEALIQACADPTMGKGSETPLTIAFQKGKQDILKALFAASFTTLDNQIGAGIIQQSAGMEGAAEDVPESAADDLREVTAQLARVSTTSPTATAGGKYGNYSDRFNPGDMESQDSEFLREEAVRLAMRTLVKQNT